MTARWLRSFDTADCYYIVDNKKTFNRHQAVDWANGNMSKIHLYWLDEVWDGLDFSRPPEKSWHELMKIRCHQIRDNSSSMVLSYSGGFDSRTIFDHCVLNKIQLDEIQINEKTFHYHPESYAAQREALEIKKHVYPNLKIKVVPVDLEYLLGIYREYKKDWMYAPGASAIHFSTLTRSSLINYNDHHAFSIDGVSNRRIVIEGHEKPRLLIDDDGWWVMTMPDGLMMMTMNTGFENFYISRDLPELHLKQTWMMIDWLESQPVDTVAQMEAFLHSVLQYKDELNNIKWNLAVGRNPVTIDHWNLELCQKTIQHGGMYSGDTLKTMQTYKGVESSDEFKLWESGAKSFIEQYSSSFDSTDGTPINVWSKRYRIKPVEVQRTRNQNIILH